MWVTPCWAWNPSTCNLYLKKNPLRRVLFSVSGSMKVNNAVGIVGFSLLRCPAVAAPDGAGLRLADRSHSLCSLHPPLAAVASLPLRYVILLNKKGPLRRVLFSVSGSMKVNNAVGFLKKPIEKSCHCEERSDVAISREGVAPLIYRLIKSIPCPGRLPRRHRKVAPRNDKALR